MDVNLFMTLLASSTLVLVIPKNLKWHATIAVQVALAAYSSWLVAPVLFQEADTLQVQLFELWGNIIHLNIDPLSAFFVLVVNFTAVTGGLYAHGYLRPYEQKKVLL